MTDRPIISIDIDDVIADSTEAIRLLVNSRAGVSLSREDYFNSGGGYWGYYNRVWDKHGLSQAIRYEDLCAEMELDQSHIPVLSGAQSAITELAKKYNIVIITSRDKSWEKATHQWFEQKLRMKDFDIYFCESHKDAQAKTKGELCRDLGVDIHIDDNVSHYKSVVKEGMSGILFGYYGWQQEASEGSMHCKDWASVLDHINANIVFSGGR